MARDQHRERHDGPEPVRITTAATSRIDDINARQRRYVISMGIRTACFVGAVLVGPGWLRWVLVAAALILPYVAVVMANAVSTKSDGFALQDNDYGIRQLPPPTNSGGAPRRDI